MKAPDKLYIGRRNYGPLIGGWKSQPFTSKEIESIEYIRKDALLEMLKASRKDLYNWYFHKEQECWKTYDEIIDKLNSI